ncbi:hypothetical protein [Sphingomonas solaris]|uniref:hypothetical protein n=1 Tax=Alterirhizorhabdus solaris TaxID=2529389 RepID=UPI001EEFBBAC|nr:hypothetical protein [Sphingomonas solaris]
MMLMGTTDRRAGEMRDLARDLLIVRSTTIVSDEASLFDPATEAARILNAGALACLKSAEELERLGSRFGASRRRLAAELILRLLLIGVVFAGWMAWTTTPPSPAEVQWMRMSEQRLSAADMVSRPETREVGDGER